MKELNKISLNFLKKSRFLTLSCIVSVFFACSLLILMFQLLHNSQKSYSQSVKEAFGDCDILISKEEYATFDENELGKMAAISGVSKLESGYWAHTKMDNRKEDIRQVAVYTVGVVDGKLNKGRYKYLSDITSDRIVINHKMAEGMNLKVGDSLFLGERELTISEILYEDNFSYQNIYFAVVDQKILNDYLGQENHSNYVLIKRDNAVELDVIEQKIKAVSDQLEVIIIEKEEEYQKLLEAFKVFMYVLAAIVICISGLFIASIFHSFLHKYQSNMMTIRTIGGKKRQVITIFMLLGIHITGCGCLEGFLFSALFGKWFFSLCGEQFDLAAEARNMDLPLAAGISGGVFLLILIFLLHSIVEFCQQLPLQALREQSVGGGVYTGKGILSRIITTFLRGDDLISYKMAVPKMKENFLLILTIVMLTAFSYVGGNLTQQINKNNRIYYENIYLDDVMIMNGDQSISYQEAMALYEKLKEADEVNVFPIIYMEDEPYLRESDYSISDLEEMEHTDLIVKKKEDYSKCVLLSKKYAQQNDIHVGDTIVIGIQSSEQVQKEMELGEELMGEDVEYLEEEVTVVGITKDSLLYGDFILDRNNSLLDTSCSEFCTVTYFASEENQSLDALLQDLRIEYPTLRWQSFSSIMKQSEKILSQRYFMISFVLYLLSILAGLGWINSVRNMLQSKKGKYLILRKLGMSAKRVQKIIWKQIALYISSGILSGALLGILIIALLDYREYEVIRFSFDIGHLWFVVLLFGVLTFSLRGIVKRVSFEKTTSQSI